MSAKLYDHTTGTWIEVPDHQVDEAVRSGNYTFEEGITIPTVSPTGEQMSIDSGRAYEAFTKNDFRWSTQADKDQANQDAEVALKRKAADSPGTALAAGVLRTATLGGSDVAAPYLAEAFGDGVTQEDARGVLADTRTQNPGWSATGEALGLLVPNPISAAGRAAKSASQATEVVSRVAPKVIAGAAEGATWSAGQAVSDAALGDPQEVLDNLVVNLGTGALLGGAFGGAFAGAEMAAPALKKKLGSAIESATDLGRSAVRSAASKSGKAVLSAAGETEAAALFGDLAKSPGFLEALRNGGPQAAQKFVREAEAAQGAFAKQTAKAERELVEQFKKLPKSSQQEVTQGMEAAGGNMKEALDDLYARTKLADDDFVSAVSRPEYVGRPPQHLQELETRVQKLITDLEGAPGKHTRPAVRDLKDTLQAKFAKSELTMADELMALRDFRNMARQMETREGTQSFATKFKSDLDEMIFTYPDDQVASLYARVIRPQDGMDALHSVVSSSIKDPNFRKLGAILASPEKFQAVKPLLSDLQDFAPQLAKIQSQVGTYQERQALLREVRDQISERAQSSVTGKISLDDVEEMSKLLTPKSGPLSARVDEIRKAAEVLKGAPDTDPLSAAILFQRAMGKDVQAMEKLLPLKDKMAAYQRLQDLKVESSVSPAMAALVGGQVGGPIGGAVASAATRFLSPDKALKTIATVDRLAAKGAALFRKASDKVVDSLTSNTVRRQTMVSWDRGTEQDRKTRYNRIAKALPQMQNPEAMADALADAASGVSGLPGFKLEMQARLATAAGFLQSKLPQDPLQPTSPFGDAQWEPSDQEVETFLRYAEAVDKPLQVIDHIGEGTVTPEEVEALRSVHPDMFARLQARVMDGILEKGSSVSYEAKLSLGQIFDIPTDYTLQPKFVAQMQDMFSDQDQGAQASQQTARPKSKLKLNPMTTVATEASKVAEGKYGA